MSYDDEVARSRERLAGAFADLRQQTGGRLRPGWLLPAVAAALGLTLAIALKRRSRDRRRVAEGRRAKRIGRRGSTTK